jgi:NPCBM/NEW2 domain
MTPLRNISIQIVCLFVSLLSNCFAQEPSRSLTLLNGKSSLCNLLEVTGDQFLWQQGVKTQTTNLADLFLWGEPANTRNATYILLHNGDRIVADVKSISATDLQFASVKRPGMWLNNSIPRSLVKAVIWQTPWTLAEQDKLITELINATDKQEQLRLSSGDNVIGTVVQTEPTENSTWGLQFQTTTGNQVFLNKSQISMWLLPSHKVAIQSEKPHFHIGLKDGSRLQVTLLQKNKDHIAIQLCEGFTLQAKLSEADLQPAIPFWERVVFLQGVGNRVKYLSSLSSLGYKHIPELSWEQNYGINESINGTALTVQGTRYLTGFSMPATSRLAFEVPAGYSQFAAELAGDDTMQGTATSVFRIFLEQDAGKWEAVFQSEPVQLGNAPIPVTLPLNKATRIALVVEMGKSGSTGIAANWLNPRFVK